MRVDDRPFSARALVGLALFAAIACGVGRDTAPRDPALRHEAYVWQHRWGPAMRAAVTTRPAELQALRVLGMHWDAGGAAPNATDVDLRTLAAAGPVTLVARIEGARLPTTLTLAPLLAMAKRWRDAGVEVHGVEIDHDCATTALPTYTRWLRRERALLVAASAAPQRSKGAVGRLLLAVTALPTWLDAPGSVRALAEAVDRVTLQVHTIVAPTIFDPVAAIADARAWAKVSDRPFWIALPTYRARLRGGAYVGVEPAEIAATLRTLRAAPIEGLLGAAWFRLAFHGDEDAWPATTLSALICAEPVRGEAVVSLRPAGPGLWDIVAVGDGNAPALVPTLLRFEGSVTTLHGANGCSGDLDGLRCPGDLRVNVGQERVLGYVRGQEVRHGG